MLHVTLLGTGGSIPLPDRFLSSALLEYKGRKILIDAGEGTQVSMRSLNCGFKDLDIICITHLHGDHVIGLQGMMGTTSNAGRTKPMTIIGPTGINDVLSGFRLISPFLNYEVNVIENPTEPITIHNDNIHGELTITPLPVQHTRPCLAYRFDIHRQAIFDVKKAKEHHIPKQYWGRLQQGEVIDDNHHHYTPNMVLGKPRKGLSLSFVTDTLPIKEIVPFIDHSDLFICCANYGNVNDKHKADKNKHMTFRDAAHLAKEGHVNQLLLTHFSQAMRHPEQYADEALSIFPHTLIGQDHLQLELNFDSPYPMVDFSAVTTPYDVNIQKEKND